MQVVKFPGWRFHEDGRSKIIYSPAEEQALEPGWHESQAEAAASKAARAAAEADEKPEPKAKSRSKTPPPAEAAQ